MSVRNCLHRKSGVDSPIHCEGVLASAGKAKERARHALFGEPASDSLCGCRKEAL